MKILDIGCGTQEQKYPNAIGIDITESNKPDVVGDSNEGLPFEEGTFDLVVSHHSLEHLENPTFILKECHRVMKPNGTLRITLPNAWWLPIRLFIIKDVNELWRHKVNTKRTHHLTHWSKDMLRMYLELNNFKIIKEQGNYLLSKEFTMEAVKKQ